MEEALLGLSLFLGAAVWGFYASWAFRRGRMRKAARWYFDEYQPDFVRNFPFAALPSAVAFTAAAIVIVGGRSSGVWVDVAVNVGSLFLIAGLVVMVAFIVRPPEFLKPEWLIERERFRNSQRQE